MWCSLPPYRSTFNCASVRFLMGVSIENPNSRPTASSTSIIQLSPCWNDLAHGTIAPSTILRFLSGMIRSGSGSICTPKPVQVGQAPCGELNENDRGSMAPNEMPQLGQAKCSEKTYSSPPMTDTI